MNAWMKSRSRRGRLITGAIAAGAGLALLLGGCASTPSGSDDSGELSGDFTTAADVDQTQLEAMIRKAFYTDVPVGDLAPVVADTLAVASQPLSDENLALLEQCLSQPICDTGRGSVKVGIPIFVTANAYINVNRAEATAQLLAYPEVREINYSISNGDIAASIANVKSLIARQVDIIVVDLAGGGSLDAVLAEARDAGIMVIAVNTPPPAATEDLLAMNFPTGLCQTYKNGVEALVSAVPEPSTFVLYTGIQGNDNAGAWQPCAKEAFEAAGWTELAPGFTNWTAQGESQAANALLASGQKPGAIVYDASPEKMVQPFIDAGEVPPAVVTGVPFMPWWALVETAEADGVELTSFMSNGHVWFSRLAVTAGIEMLHGEEFSDKTITIDLPMAPSVDVLADQEGWQDIPVGAVAGSLLSPDLIALALAAN